MVYFICELWPDQSMHFWQDMEEVDFQEKTIAASRVDTRVSFAQKSREFHAKRVSYFAKICFLFPIISCFAKLALECETKFRMFRISQNKAFKKRNETKLQHRMKKKHCFFHIKISSQTFISTIFPFTAPYIQRGYLKHYIRK